MTAFGYKLSPKVKAESIPETVIFTDTETVEREGGLLALLMGCYECWQVDGETGLPKYCRERGEYRTEQEFYEMVKRFLPCRLVAHNWNFDAAVLRIGARDNMLTHGYDIDVQGGIYPPGGGQYAPFLLRLAFDTGDACELLCNTNYYKMPLKTIGDSLGVAKLDMPSADDDAAMLEYCYRDVEILRAGYFYLHQFTQELAGVTPGITAAMAANRVFRAGYYRKNKTVQGTQHIPSVHNAERAAYHGGRTDTFYKGVPTSDTVYKYDVNSLYPSVMIGDMPVRYLQRGEPHWAERLAYGETEYIALAQADLHIPPESRYGFLGLEGVHADDKLIFPVGRFTAWVWQPLLRIAFEQGYVERIQTLLMYESESIFNDYVTDLYQRRVEYREQGNGAYVALTKLMMNSLYGKFGQRANERWTQLSPDDDEYRIMFRPSDSGMERFRDCYDDSLIESDYWQVGDSLYVCRPNPAGATAGASVLSIAGYVTAKARAELWRGLARMLDMGATLFMTDTDCIVSDMELPPDMVSPTELGKYKLEDTIAGKDCRFYAPKHYIMRGRIVLKGVRNPTDGNEHPQVVFPNFTTDLLSPNATRRERLDLGAVITRIIKRPSGVNNKRVEQGENMPTLPIVMGY